MVFGDDLDAAEQRVDSWQAELVERARRARDLAERVEHVTFEASVADGDVVAVVNHSEQLTELTLKDGVRAWPVDRISAAVLGAQRAAQQALARHLRELTEEAGFGAPS